LFESTGLSRRVGSRMEKEDDEDSRDCTEWKIDVEAPPPAETIGKSATHERTCHRSDAIHGSNHTSVGRTLSERNGVGDDEDCAREDTGGSKSGHSTTNDECWRVRSNAANERSELEKTKSGQVYPLEIEVRVKLAEEQLECAGGEEVSRSIPTDVWVRCQRVFGCDLFMTDLPLLE